MILDTNVLVSARISRGSPRLLLDTWRLQRRFDLVVCPLLLSELSDVLRRDRFRTVLTPDDVNAFVAFLRDEAILVGDPDETPLVSVDVKDDYLIALARKERIDLLVSGDRDLTTLDIDLAIVTPAEALGLLN